MNMTNLIGLGYKQRVGKDLTAKIIQYLTDKNYADFRNPDSVEDFNSYLK